jgi:hypothetical protein
MSIYREREGSIHREIHREGDIERERFFGRRRRTEHVPLMALQAACSIRASMAGVAKTGREPLPIVCAVLSAETTTLALPLRPISISCE